MSALARPGKPGKIVCVGRNYVEHAKELGHDVPGEPVIFLKPSTAVIGHGDAILVPPQSELVHHEGELAVVIGARLTSVSEADALAGVRGYTCANDVTARDLQRKDGRFTRAKGFDTFCPLGPRVVPAGELDASAVDIRVTVNGVERQRGNTRDMVFKLPRLLAYISAIMTLEPDDVVLTGTPAGVGPLVDGDVVRVTIAGIGTLENPVRRRATGS